MTNDASAWPPGPAGYLDDVQHGIAAGWAASPPNTEPVEVELVIDGLVVATAVADGLREDLALAGLATTRHGFRLPIPHAFRDGQEHSVGVRIQGMDVMLASETGTRVLEPPPAPPLPQAGLPMPGVKRSASVSVIMPTFNRGEVMERTVQHYLRCAKRLDAEVIVIDDGSADDTPDRLRRLAKTAPNLILDRVPNGGPARARNLAASMARGSLLVFVGDDVEPVDDDFLAVHAAAHHRYPGRGQAVLGKISWPNAMQLPVNFAMAHVQGDGEQQFGYRHMKAYDWYGWNLFYSSNISVKKNIVRDWTSHGFDPSFTLAAFEDAEFALRTSLALKEQGETFGIFYAPSAHLIHYHPYTVESFMRRQVSAGMMVHHFLELHADRVEDLGLSELMIRLQSPHDDGTMPLEHYFAIFEGLKSWAVVIESHYGLGSQNWHADLLRAVFQLSFLQGFLHSVSDPSFNIASGCRYVLEATRTMLNRAIATEALGDLPGFGIV